MNNTFQTALPPQQVNNFSRPYNTSLLFGRMIQNVNDMHPQDVPMDGNPAIFPMLDGSAIYVKFWDNNCNLQTCRYVLSNDPVIQEESKDPMQTILDRLDKIERRLDEKLTAQKQRQKEVKPDE